MVGSTYHPTVFSLGWISSIRRRTRDTSITSKDIRSSFLLAATLRDLAQGKGGLGRPDRGRDLPVLST